MKGFESYEEFLAWLYHLRRFGMTYGVENIKKLLAMLDNPQDKLNAVLITGSGGKGSVVSLVAYTLEKHGYKVGKFIKPHLHRYTERISINSREIPKSRLLELANEIYSKIKGSDYHPTFFEFTTALSMLYFLEENVDCCVYEVGIGGRYDATNVLNPFFSAITAVYLEHTNILGNTTREIAWNKVGIARKGGYLVYALSDKEADETVEEECEKVGCNLITVSKNGSDIRYEHVVSDLKENIFNYYGLNLELKHVKIGLLGDHQQRNGSVALGLLELLDLSGYDLKEATITEAFKELKFKGRLEFFKKNSLNIILDCAKDPTAALNLADFLKRNTNEKFTIILSISSDKDYRSMIKALIPIADHFILTEHRIMGRAIDPQILASTLKDLNAEIGYRIAEDVPKALEEALRYSEKPILVTGSLFTVAEARAVLADEETDDIRLSDPTWVSR